MDHKFYHETQSQGLHPCPLALHFSKKRVDFWWNGAHTQLNFAFVLSFYILNSQDVVPEGWQAPGRRLYPAARLEALVWLGSRSATCPSPYTLAAASKASEKGDMAGRKLKSVFKQFYGCIKMKPLLNYTRYKNFKILSDFLCGDMLCLLSLDHFSHSDSAPVAAQRREWHHDSSSIGVTKLASPGSHDI